MAVHEAVIFDLDGTLVDTAPDLTAALNFVLESLGRDRVALDDVRHMVGLGGRKLIERGLAATGGPLADPEIDQLVAQFIKFYSHNITAESRIFPGVIDTLAEIAGNGSALGVCTNKPTGLSRRLLQELGLLSFFPVVLGPESVARQKPDPAHLLETIEQLGARPARAVMVGDSENDVKAAKAARVPVIAVSFGYSTIDPEELGADAVIGHFRHLPEALAGLPRLA